MAIAAAIRMNAEGIKVQISGRLNGAEMARSESYKEEGYPYLHFELTLTTQLLKLTQHMGGWELKFGL